MFLKVTLKTSGVEAFINTRHILTITPCMNESETEILLTSEAIEERWRHVIVSHNIDEVYRRLSMLGEA